MIAIDGTQYSFPCDITRTARITSSDVSGMLMNKKEYNDALATYYDYNIKMAVPINQMAKYATFFEQLSAPVPSHVFTLPYNQDYIDIIGKINSISDVYYGNRAGVAIWRSISFTIHALEPSKEA